MALNEMTNPALSIISSPFFLGAIALMIISGIINQILRVKFTNYLFKNYPKKVESPAKDLIGKTFFLNFSSNLASTKYGWEILTGKYKFDGYLKRMTQYLRIFNIIFWLGFILGAIALMTIMLSQLSPALT